MTFPVYLGVGPAAVHPHWLFEALAYLGAGQVYFLTRGRQGDHIGDDARGRVVVAGVLGEAPSAPLP